MITTEWIAIAPALGSKAAVVIAVLVGVRLLRLLLVGLAAGVGLFHSDEERRADARKVLKQLQLRRRHRSRIRVPKTLPPSDGDERPPEQVASARQIAQVHPERRG
jgi:hypothetical protein